MESEYVIFGIVFCFLLFGFLLLTISGNSIMLFHVLILDSFIFLNNIPWYQFPEFIYLLKIVVLGLQ
jgi:hypothetical protein